jgi:hypothetical protein
VVVMKVVTMGAMVAEVMVAVVAVVAEVKGKECESFVLFDTAAYHTVQLTVP